MSELISSKEAKLAWANGKDVEFYSKELETWFSLKDDVFLSDVFDTRKLRIKQKTITINGIEVPAPFKPKMGDGFYQIYPYYTFGYDYQVFDGDVKHGTYIQFGAWRTEEEIKQVVEALRSIFK